MGERGASAHVEAGMSHCHHGHMYTRSHCSSCSAQQEDRRKGRWTARTQLKDRGLLIMTGFNYSLIEGTSAQTTSVFEFQNFIYL